MFDKFLTVEKIKRDIVDHGFVSTNFSLSDVEINEKMAVFLRFLELPLEEKLKYHYFADEFKGSDAGYCRRDRGEGANDNKEFFHYRWGMEERLAMQLQHAEKEVKDMFDVGKEVYLKCIDKLKEILAVLESSYPGLTVRFFVNGQFPARTALRFLKYDLPLVGDDFLAVGHTDSCALTIAIAESAPGLRIGPFGRIENLNEVIHQDGQAIFFPSRNLGVLTSEDDFPPSFHDVVQKANSVLDEKRKIARWALVFFAGYEGMPGKLRIDQEI